MEKTLKTKNITAIWSCNATTGHISIEKHDPKGYMHLNVHCSTVYNSQDMEATYMFINRVLDKEAVVYTYNEILLSHKKERIWVSSNEVAGPTAYCTDWSKSEREISVSYTEAYIWNLERWYWWINFQDSNGETDMENRPMNMAGREGGRGWDVWRE